MLEEVWRQDRGSGIGAGSPSGSHFESEGRDYI